MRVTTCSTVGAVTTSSGAIAGNDKLSGGSGADILNGGLGNDTAYYETSDAGVFISLYNDAAAGGDAEGDDLNDIENVTGSALATTSGATTAPMFSMAMEATTR